MPKSVARGTRCEAWQNGWHLKLGEDLEGDWETGGRWQIGDRQARHSTSKLEQNKKAMLHIVRNIDTCRGRHGGVGRVGQGRGGGGALEHLLPGTAEGAGEREMREHAGSLVQQPAWLDGTPIAKITNRQAAARLEPTSWQNAEGNQTCCEQRRASMKRMAEAKRAAETDRHSARRQLRGGRRHVAALAANATASNNIRANRPCNWAPPWQPRGRLVLLYAPVAALPA